MVKGLKDENAPTRPLSAYISWQSSVREQVKGTMPEGYSFGDLAAKFSQMWKAMSDTQKNPFTSKATAGQEKYHKQMAKYKQTPEYAAFQKLKEASKVDAVKKTKFKKDENAPSRPSSGYFLFMADNREALVNGGMAHKDALSKLGEMWSGLSAGQKKPYEEKAAGLKAKYEKELAKYQKTAAYTKYQAEKDEFYANKKAELKKLNGNKTPAKRSRSRSKSRSAKKPKAPKSASKKSSAKKSTSAKKSSAKKSSGKKSSAKKAKATK